MGLSLAEAAVRGMSPARQSEEAQEYLDRGDIAGLLELRKRQYGGFTMMAQDDDADDDADDDSDDSDEDEDDDSDDDEDDDEDEDKSGKGKKKPDAKDRRIQELSAESKKHRLKASQRGKKIQELEAEVEKLKKQAAKPKDKDDKGEDKSDEDDSELKKSQAENARLKEQVTKQTLRQEFTDLTTGPKPVAKFKNPKAAFRLLDLDDVEIDEDGEVDGLKDAIKALAKSDPYLLDTGKAKDDDADDDDDPGSGRPPVGQPTRRKGKGNPNRDKLVAKYPALRR